MKLFFTLRLVLWLVVAMSSVVMADTEILTLRLPLDTVIEHHVEAPTYALQPSNPLSVNLTLPSDIYVKLDTDLYAASAWTVRLSWPGSYPTRLRVVPGQVKQETSTLVLGIYASALSPTFEGVSVSETPLKILLEPLVAGALPQTLLPTLGALAIFGSMASLTAKPIMMLLESQAQKEKQA
ncbi:hypothetical protein BD324DRAFT_650175 [Kockovaella imperatae]|uniref:Uncharacterized protein n=1 Tax=Kockovaella imperatae TaxID=4999 RepID=A0A1Y1UJG0_9TREE|nr:hypothetical protein BD324DRAFT_650175 [Kockovaella imperatae]ORX37606.1 hypothetical protein BD324DRAFT_650175 [Kockovaella imperatae]